MGISAEELQDILHHVNAHAPLAEGRRASRVKIAMNVELTLWAEPAGALSSRQRVPSRIVDISARGGQLLHPRPLPPYSQVLLHIPRIHRGEVSILCSVIYCRPASTQKHHIGLEFMGSAARMPSPACAEDEARRIQAAILR